MVRVLSAMVMENQQNYNGLKVTWFPSKMQRNRELEAKDQKVNLALRRQNRKKIKSKRRL